jgi:hypothetical protein
MTTIDETYNGWANRATWNTHLWLTGNDENTYKIATKVAQRGTVEASALRIKGFCQDLWGSKTPDGDSLAKVDWKHVAEALRE